MWSDFEMFLLSRHRGELGWAELVSFLSLSFPLGEIQCEQP